MAGRSFRRLMFVIAAAMGILPSRSGLRPRSSLARWAGRAAQARTLLVALALAGATLAGLGCPRRPNSSSLPKLELAASPEPQAEADYREAEALERHGQNEQASQRYKAFLDVWPKDPLAPYARLALGRLELAAGRPREALGFFSVAQKAADTTLAERARMYAGVAHSQLGEHEVAVATLRPFVGRTVEAAETSLLLDALATSESAIGDHLAALETSDRELRGELPPAQRRLVEGRIQALLDTIEPTLSLERAYELLRRDGSVWPDVARRLLRKSNQRGDSAKVASVADDLRAQNIELDDELAALVLRAQRPTDADPGVVGAILPLSGRGREAGEAALQGLLLAADEPAPRGQAPIKLVYRDDGGDPERALSAFEDLVTVHRAVAVIGPLSGDAARSVAKRAKQLSVPLISLSPDASLTRDASNVFRLLTEPGEEATALVRRAVKAGAKRIAVLHPETPFGERVRTAFDAAAREQGAQLVGAVTYPPTTTNFVREAESMLQLEADALVLADAGSRISLLAPALAAKGLWSVARGHKPPEGRAVLYLIPAAGFDPALAQTTRRYLQGALFAVAFDPQRAPAFTSMYRDHYQTEPNLFSATANDAIQLLKAALYGGAKTRKELSAALLTVRAQSALGPGLGFTSERGPARPVQVETLLGDGFIAVD
ncbi:MAG TPA: penicillin-binding protein activator [Polyangiales bacterium]